MVWQSMIVAAVVAASAVWITWTVLLPQRVRQSFRTRINAAAADPGRSFAWRNGARLLARLAGEERGGGACGGCGTCGGGKVKQHGAGSGRPV